MRRKKMTTVYLDPVQLERLRALPLGSVAALIREGVALALARHERDSTDDPTPVWSEAPR